MPGPDPTSHTELLCAPDCSALPLPTPPPGFVLSKRRTGSFALMFDSSTGKILRGIRCHRCAGGFNVWVAEGQEPDCTLCHLVPYPDLPPGLSISGTATPKAVPLTWTASASCAPSFTLPDGRTITQLRCELGSAGLPRWRLADLVPDCRTGCGSMLPTLSAGMQVVQAACTAHICNIQCGSGYGSTVRRHLGCIADPQRWVTSATALCSCCCHAVGFGGLMLM